MRRFASIDFLRGLAMLIMLNLHVIMHVLDVDRLLDNFDGIPLVNMVALIVLPFMGGLAGFFLMVSAMGNMVSMYRHLEAGKSTQSLIIRQMMGGFLLLIFAMLTEGVIGYQGALGNFFRSLDNIPNTNWQVMLYRGWHFETIHTIAWCIILNGLIQGLLSKNGKWKDTKYMFKMYTILAIIVLALTPLMWMIGNPYTQGNLFYPNIGKLSTWTKVYPIPLAFIITPLAGHPEPVFPYLAASFIGSMMGMYIAQPNEQIDRSWLKKFYQVAMTLFIIGLIGFIANIVPIIMSDLEKGLGIYQRIWDHRYFTQDNGVLYAGWLFQFLVLNGFGMLVCIVFIRLVEFRGEAAEFAQSTKFVRRFGFVAFTVYCNQYVYYICHYIVSSIMIGDPYARLGWDGTAITMILNILAFHTILSLWEKVDYIGSLEWWIGTIAAKLIPGKGTKSGKNKEGMKWWEYGKLDVKNAFYEAEWININKKEDFPPEMMIESRFASKLAGASILFFPFCFKALKVAKESVEKEGINKYNSRAKTMALIGMLLSPILIIFLWSVSFSTFGITL
jgi:hypothetical protein